MYITVSSTVKWQGQYSDNHIMVPEYCQVQYSGSYSTVPSTVQYSTAELCDIYRDATVSADIDYFERYCNDVYPTRSDHIRLINCPSRNQAGIFATGEIRQNVKFATFWCVFLTKIKVDPESW